MERGGGSHAPPTDRRRPRSLARDRRAGDSVAAEPGPRRHVPGRRLCRRRHGPRRGPPRRSLQEGRRRGPQARPLLPAGPPRGHAGAGRRLHQRRRGPPRLEAQGLGDLPVVGAARRRLGLDRRHLRGAREFRGRHLRCLRVPALARRRSRRRSRPRRRLGLLGQRDGGTPRPHGGRARRPGRRRLLRRRGAAVDPERPAGLLRAGGPGQPAAERGDRRDLDEGHRGRRAVGHGQRAGFAARVRRARRNRREPPDRARDARLLPRPLRAPGRLRVRPRSRRRRSRTGSAGASTPRPRRPTRST